jgi:hypothetical protein
MDAVAVDVQCAGNMLEGTMARFKSRVAVAWQMMAPSYMIGQLTRQFFDPIRAFFVRSKLEGTFDLEQYGPIKCTSTLLEEGSTGRPRRTATQMTNPS